MKNLAIALYLLRPYLFTQGDVAATNRRILSDAGFWPTFAKPDKISWRVRRRKKRGL